MSSIGLERKNRWDGEEGFEITTGTIEINGVKMSAVVVYGPDSKEVARFYRDEIGVPFKWENVEAGRQKKDLTRERI